VSDLPDSQYQQAYTILRNASDMASEVTVGGDQPLTPAQVLATIGVGHAILALCDEVHELRASGSPYR
jgi:hypothetical protein